MNIESDHLSSNDQINQNQINQNHIAHSHFEKNKLVIRAVLKYLQVMSENGYEVKLSELSAKFNLSKIKFHMIDNVNNRLVLNIGIENNDVIYYTFGWKCGQSEICDNWLEFRINSDPIHTV